jgi:hypothetical protein
LGRLRAPFQASRIRALAGGDAENRGSAQLIDRLSVHLDLLLKALAKHRTDDTQPLDYLPRSRCQAQELLIAADIIQLLVAPPQQGIAREVASVRVKQHDLEALDPPFLLEAAPVLDALVKDVESPRLATSNGITPTHEQSRFCHIDLPSKGDRSNLTRTGNSEKDRPTPAMSEETCISSLA